MNTFWLTRNRRGRRAAPRLSLFPFLAVLICTMGALVLLLLSVTRQARLQAARVAAAKNTEKQSSIAAETEMVQWRVDQLKSSRNETAAQLAEARLLLGHLEDHSRRLRAQFAELSAQAKKATAEGLKPGNFVAPGENELRQLESQIAEAQKRLAQSRQSAADRPKSYSIVPYDGPSSTHRRPIYIECRSDAVVLQPENIVFDESDFDEPLGPGNPLAAALRAAREQMLLEHSLDPRNDGEPYPLLLVRPDGIMAYECALAAMKSWGPDYGYELINVDWQLKYSPTNPNLVRAVAQAVELARQEHARLIAAAPNKYGKRPRAGAYRSSLAGQGGAGDEQGRGGDGDSPGFYSSKPSDRYGQRYAGGGSGSVSGGTAGTGTGGSSSRGGKGGFGMGDGSGGSGIGSDESDHDGGNNASDEEYAASNPYQSLSLPAGSSPGSGGGISGGRGYGSGGIGGPGGIGSGPGGMSSQGGMSGSPGGLGGDAGGMGNGAGGPGNGVPGNMAGFQGGGGGYPGGAGSNVGGGGSPGADGSPYGGSTGSGGGATGAGGMAGGGGGGGSSGSPGGASGGMPSLYSPTFGQQDSQGAGQGGSGQAGMQGSAQPGTQSNSQAAYQGGGQPGYPANGQPAGTATAAAVPRPDGYITGQPADANPNPPPQRPNPPSGVAMVPDTPLRPGEWRPSDDPPKPDPEEEKKKKKKHPYDNVEPDHNQADWALRDARRHAAAISRPVHVDCYPDRVVIAPEQPGGEPHVVVCGSDGQRNADKLVAAVWELMDSWGMAGKEMYWRPVLNFYVVPGAEPRMFELSRALDGSGLVIERKQ